MSLKERLIGAKVVNGKDNGKGNIEYLILRKGDKTIYLKPRRVDDVISCEELK